MNAHAAGGFPVEVMRWLPSFLALQTLFSLIVFVMVFLVSLLLKNRYRSVVLGLWALVFVRLILPVDFALPVSVRTAADKLISLVFDSRSLPRPAPFPLAGAGSPALQAPTAPAAEKKTGRLEQVLALGWLAAVAALMTVQSLRRRAVRREIRRARVLTGGRWVKSAAAWRERLSVRRQITLVCGRRALSPFTVGWFKPVIYIPQALMTRATGEIVESVIGHEMAHINGWDALWSMLRCFLQTVYFFNPAVWIAGGRIRQIREYACDETAMNAGGISRQAYGGALLRVVRMNMAPAGTDSPFEGLLRRKELMARRLRNVKRSTVQKKHTLAACILVVTASIFILPLAAHSGRVVLPYAEGTYLAPPMARGYVCLEYGWDRDAASRRYYLHKGIDIKWTDAGAGIVHAAAAGEVTWVGEDEVFPWCTGITMRHFNDFETRYLHLGVIFVKPGQWVKSGQTIGYVANGVSALHFEVSRSMTTLDPELYVALPKRLERPVIKNVSRPPE